MMTAETLAVKNLQVQYKTQQGMLTAVQDVSFSVCAGEIVGVVGESGCGKSTVASAVMRLLPANGQIVGGHVLFKDRDICQLGHESIRHLRGRQMSMIFQDPTTSLNPVFNIANQMIDVQRAHEESSKKSRKALIDRAIQMIERVGIPDAEQRILDFPHQLSGGMCQRMMIATALLLNPALLVADEPTSALDVTLEAQITDLIRELRNDFGTAILFITHDLGVVAQICDRVIIMYAGNIVESGSVGSIFDNPKHPYTQALLQSHPSRGIRQDRLTTIRGRVPSLKDRLSGCKFAPRCDFAQDVCRTTSPEYSSVDEHPVLCHAFGSASSGKPFIISAPWKSRTTRLTKYNAEPVTKELGVSSAIAVETRELSTHFYDRAPVLGRIFGKKAGVVKAVNGVSISIRRGESMALVGESGCGKTTLGRTILGLEQSTGGEIIVNGQPMGWSDRSEVQRMRAQMQMIFQDPISSLSPRRKVSSLLLEPFHIRGFPVDQGKVDQLLDMVGLSSELADKYPHQLSGGQARRVGIARALALRPAILVADEPTSGLDVSVAAGILNLLKDLREEYHLTYLIITHNLSVVSFVADRVAVMYLGKIVELAQTEELFSEPRHPYTESLLSAIAVPDPGVRGKRRRIVLKGEVPSPRSPPPGCPFSPRCHFAHERCRKSIPPLVPTGGNNHLAACHYVDQGKSCSVSA